MRRCRGRAARQVDADMRQVELDIERCQSMLQRSSLQPELAGTQRRDTQREPQPAPEPGVAVASRQAPAKEADDSAMRQSILSRAETSSGSDALIDSEAVGGHATVAAAESGPGSQLGGAEGCFDSNARHARVREMLREQRDARRSGEQERCSLLTYFLDESPCGTICNYLPSIHVQPTS